MLNQTGAPKLHKIVSSETRASSFTSSSSVLYIYMWEHRERAAQREYRKGEPGENVVRICCSSTKCDVTKKKRYAKNIIKKRAQCFVCFLSCCQKKCLGVSVPLRKHFVRGTKRELNLAAFSEVFLPLKPLFPARIHTNYTYLLTTEREYLFFNNIFFS